MVVTAVGELVDWGSALVRAKQNKLYSTKILSPKMYKLALGGENLGLAADADITPLRA